MCLDVNSTYNNQNKMKERKESVVNSGKVDSIYDFPIKCVCGGSIVDHKPVFDPKGEIIYVVWNDKVRLFSVQTGECIRDLEDNKDGQIVGLFVNPENKKTLIACTTNGTVLSWKLDSYVISTKLKLKLAPSFIVNRFVASSIDGEPHGIVCFKDEDNHFQLSLVELTKSGKIVRNYQLPFINNEKKEVKVRLADGHSGSNFFVVVQRQSIYIVDKSSSNFVTHTSGNPINVVVCHPEEEMVATGDIKGKILLWRNIFDKSAIKAELHWHHQIVLSLEFSQSGTILYSGGVECVLVKWQIKDKSITKGFLPRLPGDITEISVDPNNDKLTISTDDNAIQIINSNLDQLKSIQDFTRTAKYDMGHLEMFPAGLQMNPRNSHIVTNGRIGHLQFFSTRTMKLLFNVDISMRNVMPREKSQNIFSTQVTRVAFSMDWMSTVESWNDKVHSPDSRLKFWKFLDDRQTYSLHTQIEQAHAKEIIAVQFSSQKNKKDIICATAGLDNRIKIWSLEKTENVKSAKSIWLCIEELTYKNLPVTHFGFSQDSSLIGAGFGNILCVWDTLRFQLKCALSAPPALDGSTNRVILTLPAKTTKKVKDVTANTIEQRRKILDLMKAAIEGTGGESLVKNVTQKMKERYFTQKTSKVSKPKELSKAEKEEIFKKVISIPDLSFNQKIEILHKLNIYYKISNRVEKELTDFITRTSLENHDLFKSLFSKLDQTKSQEKYKLQWRFRMWNSLTSKRNRKLVTIRKLLTHKIDEKQLEKLKTKELESEKFLPVKNLTKATNVVFCTEECSHLVVVTTPDRVLIWNLLTLKLQGSFKLHTKFITLDPLTNLIAVFTKYNELFVFQPNPALTIHHQKNVPDIYGAIWVPRENPRAQSAALNWQAMSQLLFLKKNQEICCLKLPGEEDFGNAAPFMELSNGFTTNTPFAAMIAKKMNDETAKDSNGMTKRITVSGAGAIKDIINLSSHAMPPIRLLSKDFIGSMLAANKSTKPQHKEIEENIETMEISDDENEITSEDNKIVRRRAIEKEEKAMREKGVKKKEATNNIENRMKNLKLDFIQEFEL